MISFRYHLVTIVAVFVALAVGILIGGTLLNANFESGLKGQVASFSKRVDELHRQTLVLQGQVKDGNQFGGQAERWLTQGRLTGEPVVLVTDHGVDPREVAGVRQALAMSGATLQGVVVLEPGLSDPGAQDALAQAMGVPASTPPGELASETAKALAHRLVDGAPAAGTAPGDDALTALAGGGFVSVTDAAKGGAKAIGGPGQSVVLLAGAQQPAVDAQQFIRPFLQTLVDDGRPSAAGEASTALGDQSYLSIVRGDGALEGNIVTVDNVDQVSGQSALVLGLANLIQTGAGGDYGSKCDSCTILPRP